MARPHTSYGQFHVAEPYESLASLHIHDGVSPLVEKDWEPKNGVLDQEDLFKQGIDTSALVPGAAKVDALGSCTANANASALSWVLSEADYLKATGATSYNDTVSIEKFAIVFYHDESDLTGQASNEWPPNDNGGSGPYIVQEDQKRGYVSGAQIASGAQNLISLLQTGPVLQGGPFLNAWEQPPANFIVDGDGTPAELHKQIQAGVAGGHETLITGITKLTVESGAVVPSKTILKVRNSWSSSWGDNGSFFIHLSTLVALGRYYDFRQLQAVAAS
jgi:hypothetical protein